jgi:hypothetical protein
MKRHAAFIVCWLALFIAPSFAQAPHQFATSHELERATSRYYEKPVDLASWLTAWERLGAPGTSSTLGFLAGVFTKYPDQIGIAMNAPLNRTAQVMVINALRLAGKTAEAKRAAQGWNWPPDQTERITPVLPLHSIKPKTAEGFDTFWGASFATGDPAYVRPIYNFYATAVAQPDIDLNDVVAVVISRHRRDNQTIAELGKKQPREVFIRIVFAATALWSLESNARQHKFVAAALDRYVKEQPNSPAAKGLSDLRKALGR